MKPRVPPAALAAFLFQWKLYPFLVFLVIPNGYFRFIWERKCGGARAAGELCSPRADISRRRALTFAPSSLVCSTPGEITNAFVNFLCYRAVEPYSANVETILVVFSH
ncbi:MAG: hypothetical protein [Cressdnaviricota sp.]|nr:MAG: hypothetical protein [Cressdnaviricota sp.]